MEKSGVLTSFVAGSTAPCWSTRQKFCAMVSQYCMSSFAEHRRTRIRCRRENKPQLAWTPAVDGSKQVYWLCRQGAGSTRIRAGSWQRHGEEVEGERQGAASRWHARGEDRQLAQSRTHSLRMLAFQPHHWAMQVLVSPPSCHAGQRISGGAGSGWCQGV